MDCVNDVDGEDGMKFEWRMYNFKMVAEVLRIDVRGGYCYNNTWVGLQNFFFHIYRKWSVNGETKSRDSFSQGSECMNVNMNRSAVGHMCNTLLGVCCSIPGQRRGKG